jgi:hypothetical protein
MHNFCVDVSQCSQWRDAEAAAKKHKQSTRTQGLLAWPMVGHVRMQHSGVHGHSKGRAGHSACKQVTSTTVAKLKEAMHAICTRSGRPTHSPLMAARLASTRCTAERNREHVWDADKMSRGEKRCATTSSTMMSRDSASAHTALPTPSASQLPDDVGASRLPVWTSSSCIGAAPPSCASSHAVGGWPSDAIVELMIVSSPQRGTVMRWREGDASWVTALEYSDLASLQQTPCRRKMVASD